MNYKLLLCSALVMGPVTAYANQVADDADHRHFYAGGHIGLNEGVDWPAKVDLGAGIVVPGRLNTDAQIHGGVQLGYQYDHARLEVELQHGGLNVKEFSLGAVSGGEQGSINYSTLMMNGHRRFDITDKFGISLGAGAGLARINFPKVETGTSCNCLNGFSNNVFSYQFRVGFEYEVSRGLRMVGSYSQIFLPSIKDGNFPATNFSNFNIGVASIGFRMRI